MLTLDNFEKQIASVIVQRGRDYYNDGCVIDLEEIADHVWSAEVSGTDDYSVEVSLNDENEICDFSCDCPYDGPVCKHVAAVCFAIREEKAKTKNIKSTSSSRRQKKNTFEDVLNAVSLEECRDFICRLASRDKDFKTQFELFFSEKMDNPDIEKKYSNLIKKIVRKYSDHGYIDYRSSRHLSAEMDNLLAQGHDMIGKCNFRDAFLLSKAALKTLIEVIQDCDDSSGAVGDSLFGVIELFTNIASSAYAAPAVKQEVFNFLQIELAQKHYFDYGDFGYDLFSVYRSLAVPLNQTDAFMHFIDKQCSKCKYDDYDREFFQKEKIAFYIEKGCKKEAEELIKQNLDIVDVRQAEVEKAINRKGYAEAKQLINDGIKIAESNHHPGTISEWKKELLRIAVAENDTEAIRSLSLYFIFDSGFDTAYYRQWKQTFSAAEQKDAVESLIAQRIDEANQAYSKHRYFFSGDSHLLYLWYVGVIYIEEQMWDRLFKLVQDSNNLNILLEYHEHLVKHYPKEMLELYLPQFNELGNKIEGRSQYADFAKNLKLVQKDIPEAREPIIELVNGLIARYPRRPAMIDELSKVLKA